LAIGTIEGTCVCEELIKSLTLMLKPQTSAFSVLALVVILLNYQERNIGPFCLQRKNSISCWTWFGLQSIILKEHSFFQNDVRLLQADDWTILRYLEGESDSLRLIFIKQYSITDKIDTVNSLKSSSFLKCIYIYIEFTEPTSSVI